MAQPTPFRRNIWRLGLLSAALLLAVAAVRPPTYEVQSGRSFDKIIEVDYSKITYDPQGRPLLPRDSGDTSNRPRRVDTAAPPSNRFNLIDLHSSLVDKIDDLEKIFLARGDNGLWRFSAETVAAIEDIYPRWKNRENVI